MDYNYNIYERYMSINYTNIILIILGSMYLIFSIKNSLKRQQKIKKYLTGL